MRRASRFRRRPVVLGLLIGAAAIIAVAVGIAVSAPDSGLRIVPDLTPLGDALARGELPIELLLVGAGAGLVVGLAITLLVATIRDRRRGAQAADHLAADHPPVAHPADTHPADAQPADAQPARVPADSAPSAMTWPTEDAYSYAPSPPASWATTAREDPPADSPWFDPHRTDDHALPEVQEARDQLDAVSATEMRAPPVASARAEQVSLPGSHTPLAAALGTVATGAAFAIGAVVGAGVGVTVAAAIGIAFAVGAGAAVAATTLLLRSQRR